MLKINTAIAFLAFHLCSTTAHAVVTFDWATVGNPNNPPDRLYSNEFNPNNLRFGAVDYTYRISKHEVTNAQYTEFLNAVDPLGTNPHSVYASRMESDPWGGINFSSDAPSGSKYFTKTNMGSKPVNFVSFLDAMRFVNWLENGQPTGGGGTESGAYTIGNGVNEKRAPGATFFIPSEDEWYKAAYHKNDGVTANYWLYPTSTDVDPFSDQPPGGDAPMPSNTVNFRIDDGMANGYDDGYAVTGSNTFDGSQNYLTDVGAYALSLSSYGTFDQGGNVWEWNEGVIGSRSIRGGGWYSGFPDNVSASFRNTTAFTSGGFDDLGFRVASVPEPSTGLLGASSILALLKWRRRRN